MILLASQSSGRLSTLRAAGVEPLVRVSGVDEPAVLADQARARAAEARPAPSPSEQVQALARAKALDVASSLTAAERDQVPAGDSLIVIGSDSMLEIDGQVLGKPPTPQVARERWLAMRARSGVLHTGHTLVRDGDGARVEAVSSTIVHFGDVSEQEIDAYVATGEPLWCAGAFTIDALGGAFIDGVEGDPHGVVGISLPLVRRLLVELGESWTAQWSRPRAGAAQ